MGHDFDRVIERRGTESNKWHKYGANRNFLADYARKHLPGVVVAPREGTSLAWLDGATFGRGGAGFVRLNFGCPRSQLAEGLDRMRDALAAARR